MNEVLDMCDKYGFKYKKIDEFRYIVDNGEDNNFMIVFEKSKTYNKKKRCFDTYNYLLLHQNSFTKTNHGYVDDYHIQRRFIDLDYLGKYLVNHKLYSKKRSGSRFKKMDRMSELFKQIG